MVFNILIIGTEPKWEEEELSAAFQRSGVKAYVLDPKKIVIRLGDDSPELLYWGMKNITELFKKSRIIFRRTRGAQEKMLALVLLAKHLGIPFTDTFDSICSNLNKAVFLPSIRTKHIAHIPTHFISKSGGFHPRIKNLKYPVLIKPSHGRHGDGIKIFKTEKALRGFLAKNTKDILLQEFLPIEEEFRIFVVGGKALGAVKKVVSDGKFIANYSRGTTFIPFRMGSSLLQESVKICGDHGIDIGGVDIARVGETYYLLEVNRCPEFRGFSGATGIAVADTIRDFVLKLPGNH